MDCRGYRTPFLRGIHLASRYGNACPTRRKLSIPTWPRLWLFLTIGNTSIILYHWSRFKVRALGRHSLILMFHTENVEMISCACIGNGRHGRLLFERPGRVSKQLGGAV